MEKLIPSAGACQIIVACAVLVAITTFLIVHRAVPIEGKRNAVRRVKAISGVVALIGVVALVWVSVVELDGSVRGMTNKQWWSMPLGTVVETNGKTPLTDSVPDDAAGDIVILYKYGCPDCEAVYSDIEKAASDTGAKNVIYIASSTADGKRLVKDNDIKNVPTGIYIRREKLANGASTAHAELDTTDSNGKTSFDRTAFERLVLLQRQRK